MEQSRVGSWDDLLDKLFVNSWRENLGRFRSPFAFRGMSRADYQLTTSLGRLGDRAARELEVPIVRAFRKYAQGAALPRDSIWDWLALGQHHGLSTRLLDWTYSPLVAMHFATENDRCMDVDGVIWGVNYHATNALLPPKLQRILAEEGSNVFTAEMLDRAAGSLRAFDDLTEEPFVAFFEPPSLDERIVNQYALFSLVSDPNIDFGDWLRQHPGTAFYVVVPAELKPEIRDRLDQANITERVLYPGLDGLTRWLNRYYTPRRSAEPVAPPGQRTNASPS